MVIDPVCKMSIDENKTSLKSNNKGQIYYFCSPSCKQKFDKQPEKYIRK